MKRTATAFICLILLLCLVPSLGMLALGPSAARANEVAPAAPNLTERDGSFNTEFLSDAADYVNESFSFRQELITLWARVEALFGQSAEDGVILGSDGWLYYADELADYTGSEPMTEREIFAAAYNLALMRDYVESLGADFVFTIAPNKSSLYPGHMPDYTRSGEPGNAERLAEALKDMDITYVNLFEAIGDAEGTYYFAHDSHWTSSGAAIAADAINAALGIESAFAGGCEYETRSHSGDLYEMLYPAAADPETDDVPVGLDFTQGEGVRPDSITIDTAGAGERNLLVFRDSFGELLYPFLAAGSAGARFSRQSTYDLTMAGELNCDAVVIELVERNLSWLFEQPAVFPAPELAVEGIPAATGEATLELEKASDGFHRVTGVISGEIDVDSPVLISYNGKGYAASLTADGCTAVLPGVGGGEYTLVWYAGGEARSAEINM